MTTLTDDGPIEKWALPAHERYVSLRSAYDRFGKHPRDRIIESELRSAHDAIWGDTPWRQRRKGTDIERAWANLHEVEVRLVDLRPKDELEIVVAEALQHATDLNKHDARVKELNDARKHPDDRERLCAAVRSVLRASHEASDRDYQDARAFRDRLARVTVGLAAAIVTLIVAQWLVKAAFLPNPSDVHMGRVPLLLVVMLFGSIGALISGVSAVVRTPRDHSPFHVPTHQMLVKLALGALTAVLGVALAANGAAANGLDSMQGYIALAAAFGAGQQVVTKAVDDKAGTILSKQD